MNVAVYYRVSTRAQGEDDRLGLPVQVAEVEAYCRAQGHDVVESYADVGCSGATADRPQLAGLLERAGAGAFEAVIVCKWDRLARDTMLDGYLRYQLAQRGVRVLSATETNGIDPISTMTQQILAAVAQYERALIAQRLSAARRLKKQRGGYAGGKPRVGLRVENGTLVRDDGEGRVVALAMKYRSEGLTVRAIAEALNARGLRARSGRPWASSTVHAMLRRGADASSAGT